jgi:hypothetical protein
MKDTYYFQHDYEPTSDPKMVALLGDHGAVGYGIYWRIVEMLHSDTEHKLPHKKYIYLALAKQMLTSVEQIEAIVNFAIQECELLKSDGEYFWSDRVIRNIERRNDISKKRSKAGKASARAKQVLTSVEQNSTNANKGKERKVNKRKVNKSSDFADDSTEFILAKHLYSLMKKNDPNAKEPDFQKWAANIDRLMRIDGRDPQIIKRVLDWSQNHSFWKSNILSTTKLREQFPKLLLQMQGGTSGSKPTDGIRTNTSKYDVYE